MQPFECDSAESIRLRCLPSCNSVAVSPFRLVTGWMLQYLIFLCELMQQGTSWKLQLLSVACMSLAAKMEETEVPFLLDLQVTNCRQFSSSSIFRTATIAVVRYICGVIC